MKKKAIDVGTIYSDIPSKAKIIDKKSVQMKNEQCIKIMDRLIKRVVSWALN